MLQGVLSFLFDVQATTSLCHALKWIHAHEHVKIVNKRALYSSWNMKVMLRLIYVLGLLFANTAASNKHNLYVLILYVPMYWVH